MATTEPYGRWASPLTASDVAGAKVSLSELCSDGRALYWLESRPAEAGRVALVRCADDGPVDHSPPDVSIRSRVHEYGGGALCLVPGHGDGAFAYVNQADQRVWMCVAGGEQPRPLSEPAAAGEEQRHGGLGATADGDWVLAVREVHPAGGARPVRSIVALPTRPAALASTLLSGHDFFGAPRVDAAGERLAVVVWDHPDMPWDASALVVVPVARTGRPEGTSFEATGPAVTIAGGAGVSVGQPSWQHDGRLRFVSDAAGWWQPSVVSAPRHPTAPLEPQRLTDDTAEFHGPDWVLGLTTMAERADGTVVARRTAAGRDTLVELRTGGSPRTVEQPCLSIAAVCAHGDAVAVIGATPDAAANVWLITPGRPAAGARPLRTAARTALGPDDVARGEPFTCDGPPGRPVHGTLYRPTLGTTVGPADAPPPLVVWCHGGPTSACQPGLDPTLQFFTSRGFAVACVDYAGSSGYGRAYRCALWERWGVADAEDCLAAALHLAGRGDVDAGRMAIRGGSAGGMTALNALASGEGFAACVAWYGVTDLLGLVATTHDFEAHYTDRLIGPLPAERQRYVDRSPVTRAAAMSGSVLLLQGTEDAVVPPAQAEAMRDALAEAGHPCDLRFFEGEGHGFRRADTLTVCLETEWKFYLEELRL